MNACTQHWRAIIAGVVLAVTAPASATASAFELETRLVECSQTVRDIMQAPDGGIPADLLQRSRGIIIFPAVIKAGLGVGGHYGKGAALRRDPRTGKWGPPVFLRFIGGSFGWQVGVQETAMVILIMNDISLKGLFRDRITIGADASIAAGPVGRDASARTDLGLSVGMLSYSKARGLFAGVSLKGSVLEVDWHANERYYGSDVSVTDIFFHGKGRLSKAGRQLQGILTRHTAP